MGLSEVHTYIYIKSGSYKYKSKRKRDTGDLLKVYSLDMHILLKEIKYSTFIHSLLLSSKLQSLGVPTVARWDWQHLGSTGMQVRSPAQHSGLRIQCCHSCGIGCTWGLDLIPDPGTPYASRWPKRKTQETRHISLFSWSLPCTQTSHGHIYYPQQVLRKGGHRLLETVRLANSRGRLPIGTDPQAEPPERSAKQA